MVFPSGAMGVVVGILPIDDSWIMGLLYDTISACHRFKEFWELERQKR